MHPPSNQGAVTDDFKAQSRASKRFIAEFINIIGQNLPSRDFCGTAALPR
jgi:hypothetical protein